MCYVRYPRARKGQDASPRPDLRVPVEVNEQRFEVDAVRQHVQNAVGVEGERKAGQTV